MKIEWNKVTWYSKLLALALFVVLPFIGFWYGIQYGKTVALLGASPQGNGSSSATSGATSSGGTGDYYQNVAEWQTESRLDGGFSIAYPIDFTADENYSATPTTDWRLDANGTPGLKMLTITIPSAFEPQTNFADATLTVGASADSAAVAGCLAPDPSGPPNTSATTATVNGINFSVFTFSGAGAGNLYQTTSYRTVHANKCYAVEYTLHSSQIANYPSSYNLQPFDPKPLTDVLNRIVGTFSF